MCEPSRDPYSKYFVTWQQRSALILTMHESMVLMQLTKRLNHTVLCYWRIMWQHKSISIGTVWHQGIFSVCCQQHRLSSFMTYLSHMVIESHWDGKYVSLRGISTLGHQPAGAANAAIYIWYVFFNASVFLEMFVSRTLTLHWLQICWFVADTDLLVEIAPTQ